jgi:hypothetical protein
MIRSVRLHQLVPTILLFALAQAQEPQRPTRHVFEGVLLPLELLRSEQCFETPALGWVEVERAQAESLQGRLGAIGQGAVWLETPGGTLRVAAQEIRALTQIPGPPAAQPSAARVRTVGGWWVGTPLERGSDGVRLRLADGSQVWLRGSSSTQE